MREIAHWAIEIFFICVGVWAARGIYITLREVFEGR